VWWAAGRKRAHMAAPCMHSHVSECLPGWWRGRCTAAHRWPCWWAAACTKFLAHFNPDFFPQIVQRSPNSIKLH